jgi:hypothetical protein
MNAAYLLVVIAIAISSAGAQKVGKLTEELRLDATKEDFPRVGGVHIGPRGQMAVMIPRDNQIRLYDSVGRRLGVAGRSGSGPGEFRAMTNAGWVSDTLWVFDHQQRRTVFVGSDGKVLRTTPMPSGKLAGATAVPNLPMGMFLIALAVYGDGQLLVSGRAVFSGNSAREFFGLMKPDGSITEITGIPNSNDPKYWMTVGGLTRGIPLIIPPRGLIMHDGSGYGSMVVENSRPNGGVINVTTFRLGGAKNISTAIPFDGVLVPRRVRDSLLALENPPPDPRREGSELGPRFQEIARQRMPAFYPPVTAARFGLDGSVWMQQRTTESRQSYRVLDQRGTEVGTVTLPERTTLSQATLTHVWVVERDVDDLPSVLRHRLTWH